ncbi:histone acetylation protein 2 [Annulohypoxylon truncatum]|uniref:histone acetylation protein 2 n=1 Tax=Annulohypoxylon truncatum TaxID=327061 RepID=UPI0020077BC5|nr:histone acetylation protein 2 [Annulohypoxylon truncatum]KAI1214826.1 histone acetylation protein 2 [Annulohypoxylon truncatum]
MPSSAQSHARSHALLLLQKLLNLRDSASPLTLVLDTLEQSAKPLIREFLSRAKATKSKTIFLSFSTLKKPADVDIFIKARGKSPETLRAELTSHYPSGTAGHAHKVLVVIDALNPLAQTIPSSLSLFLSSLVTPLVSLVGVYHADVPLVLPPPASSGSVSPYNEYEPHPLTTLSHLATAVLRVGSLYQAVERRRAENRSLPAPEWGLAEGREGVLIGLGRGGGRNGSGSADGDGFVLEMEMRRRSGRSVAEKFVLVPRAVQVSVPAQNANGNSRGGKIEASRLYLLSDHPAFRDPGDDDQGGAEGEGEEMETTFNLGLTEKQRRDREGIVLPYFDAQKDIGAGEGGRILYEMGREDDFDDEEDEI